MKAVRSYVLIQRHIWMREKWCCYVFEKHTRYYNIQLIPLYYFSYSFILTPPVLPFSCSFLPCSTILQVNEQIGSGDWSDGAELGSTWEGRNSFSYGRQTPSVGAQTQGLPQGQTGGHPSESVYLHTHSIFHWNNLITLSAHQQSSIRSHTNIL